MKFRNMVCKIEIYGSEKTVYVRVWRGKANVFVTRQEMRTQYLKPVLYKVMRGGKLEIVPRGK